MTTCARYADAETAERYVLGQMNEADQASFEEHFFGCDDCFASVRTLQQMQTALRTAPLQVEVAHASAGARPAAAAAASAITAGASGGVVSLPGAGRPAPARPAPVRTTGTLAGVSPTWWGLAVAASLLLGILWWQGRSVSTPQPEGTVVRDQQPQPQSPRPQAPTPGAGQGTTPGAGSGTGTPGTGPATTPGTGQPQAPRVEPAPGPGTTPARPARDLGTLAMVVPPPYVPLQTRGSADTQEQAFTAAMTKYNAKDYQGAVDGLRAIADTHPEAAHAQFFLGVSLLMVDKAADARQALERAAASGTAPFADEAHFYLAKAALRERDLPRAKRELQLAVEREAGPAGEAARLLREVTPLAP